MESLAAGLPKITGQAESGILVLIVAVLADSVEDAAFDAGAWTGFIIVRTTQHQLAILVANFLLESRSALKGNPIQTISVTGQVDC